MTRAQLLTALGRLIRRRILEMTTRAGSGHPTSSLSAVELMTALMFDGHFRYDVDDPDNPNNDRLVFSKGHASPLFYALWMAAGGLDDDELRTYRDFDGVLEGHPTPRFRHTVAATGSLGQGLSVGLGLALNAARMEGLPYRTYVLLGDGEMAEGSVWEAMEIAAHYALDNLVGIVDVNRLGQSGPTLYGHDIDVYARRAEACGWHAVRVADGHDVDAVSAAYAEAAATEGRPTLIVARTEKGRGVPEVADRNGWHGKPLDGEQLARALEAVGDVDGSVRGRTAPPDDASPDRPSSGVVRGGPLPDAGEEIATRDAFGHALVRLRPMVPGLVCLDGDVGNSTRTEWFGKEHRDRFLELYIAEQNMVGAAIGLARSGCRPVVSTFAAFLTRAYDQIRMAAISDADIIFNGSHAGVAIGEDGPSQMGLEDLAMFRAVHGSTVLVPADAVATQKLLEHALRAPGIVYLRTNRQATPVIYTDDDVFSVGGCRVLRSGDGDQATIVTAGATLFEALAAYEKLVSRGFTTRIIDLYSVKPLDEGTLRRAARETGLVLTVEDHYPEGGLGEAVAAAVAGEAPVRILAVRRKPRSGDPRRLLDYEGIDADSIVEAMDEFARSRKG